MEDIRKTLAQKDGLNDLNKRYKQLGYLPANIYSLIHRAYLNIDSNTLTSNELSNLLILQQTRKVKFNASITAKLRDLNYENVRHTVQTFSDLNDILNLAKTSDIETVYNNLFKANSTINTDNTVIIDLNKFNPNEIHNLCTLILDKKIELNESFTNALAPEVSKIQHERDLNYVKRSLQMGPPFMDEYSLEEKYFPIITDTYKDIHSSALISPNDMNKSYCEKMNLYSLYKVGKINLPNDLVTDIEKELKLVKTPKKSIKNPSNLIRKIKSESVHKSNSAPTNISGLGSISNTKSQSKPKFNLISMKRIINLISLNKKNINKLLGSTLAFLDSPFKTSALLNTHRKNKFFSKFKFKKHKKDSDITFPTDSTPTRNK